MSLVISIGSPTRLIIVLIRLMATTFCVHTYLIPRHLVFMNTFMSWDCYNSVAFTILVQGERTYGQQHCNAQWIHFLVFMFYLLFGFCNTVAPILYHLT